MGERMLYNKKRNLVASAVGTVVTWKNIDFNNVSLVNRLEKTSNFEKKPYLRLLQTRILWTYIFQQTDLKFSDPDNFRKKLLAAD